jgi:2-polyprenyl-3-methyl-5-hydroxy-6-metoxy-1,4-benzoquinol methylase
MAKHLSSKYSGTVAANYDKKRSSSKRWANETAVFQDFLSQVNPATVLDCPFGTGRWISYYDISNISVIGIDVSTDMLSYAYTKIQRPESYRLIAGSIFDFDFKKIKADLIVCTRFLNWVRHERAREALSCLSRAEASTMILGCSVIPREKSNSGKNLMKGALLWRNLRKRKSSATYVHNEEELVADIATLGWKIVSRKFIFSNKSRYNYFYLLSR